MSRTYKRKKYLLRKSRRKGKGRDSEYFSYAFRRHRKENNPRSIDHYKSFEPMRPTKWSSLDYSLIKRWLQSKLGCHWDDIYSEWLNRIQSKYKDSRRHVIYWYVDTKNVRILHNGTVETHDSWLDCTRVVHGFYVHPQTQLLCKTPDRPSTKLGLRGIRKWELDVLSRDKRKCVVCGGTVKIHPYRVFVSNVRRQGYTLNNGVSLCRKHYRELLESRIYRENRKDRYTEGEFMDYEMYLLGKIGVSYKDVALRSW